MESAGSESRCTEGNSASDGSTSSKISYRKQNRQGSFTNLERPKETIEKAVKIRNEPTIRYSFKFRFPQGSDTTDWKQAADLVWQNNFSEWPHK